MKKLILLSITIGCLFLLFGCKPHHRKTKVHCYVTHTCNDNNDDLILYWYLWYGPNSQCYYYSSPTPVSNYSGVSWTTSSSKPAALTNEEETQEQELNETEVSEEMQGEVEASPEGETDSGTDSGSDSGSDSGGDSGGGDGGGGGD